MNLPNWMSEQRDHRGDPNWRRVISSSIAGFLVAAVLFVSMSMFYRIDASEGGGLPGSVDQQLHKRLQ